MEGTTSKILLDELRSENSVINWRRQRVHPKVETWKDRFLAESATLSSADKLTAQVFLAQAQVKPIQMAQFLCDLAFCDGSDLIWIRTELDRIFSVWEKVREFGLDGPDADIEKFKVRLSLHNLVRTFPKQSVFHKCLAISLKEDVGLSAALDYLEGALAKGLPVVDTIFFFVQRSLNRPESASAIRFAASITPWLQKKFGTKWSALALKRSVAFASLLAMRPMPPWIKLIDLKILEEHSDFRRTLDKILLDISLGDKKNIPSILHRLAKVDVFWVSALSGAEEARQKFIDAVFAAYDANMKKEDRLHILLALYECIPTTVQFWTDPSRRRQLSSKMLEISDDLPGHYSSMIKGRFSLALGDYDAAAENFIDCSKESPTTRGPSTYVDFRSVKNALNISSAEILKAWPAVSYEVLNSGNLSNEPYVIITANDRYFHLYLEKYFRSLARLCADGRVHVHLFGKPDTTRHLIREYSKYIPQYQISFSYENIVIDQPYFFASGRFLRIQEWAVRFSSPCIMTDIDNLWGQEDSGSPLFFMNKKLAFADVGLNLRSSVEVQKLSNSLIPGNRYPSPDPWRTIWAGKIFLRGNRSSSQFAEILSCLTHQELQKAMRRNPTANWFIDQNILSAAYAYARRHYPDIKFADLSDVSAGQNEHWMGIPTDIAT